MILLNAAANLWFAVALLGQWAFLCYIAAFYGVSTLHGDFAHWSRNRSLYTGYVAGDTVGNLVFAAHVLLAAIVAFAGILQLVPWLRARLPAVHRWNGRLFLGTAIAASVAGLYMVWVRGSSDGVVDGIAISLDAVLVIAFGVLAWRAAMARRFASHRRWALRAYIAASAVWFYRLMLFGWVFVNRGPVALATVNRICAFACYLLPLAVLELYLRAETGAPRERHAMAALLFFLTCAMSVGIFAAYMLTWRRFI